MNIALILAGGTGTRMTSKTKPKQFLELHGKPIVIYTLEHFENNPLVDGIVVTCLEDWIPYLEQLLKKFSITKVAAVVPGGSTGQESIYNGLNKMVSMFPHDSVVLVHDGVRPLLNEEIIEKCIDMTKKEGSAVTVAPATETIVTKKIEGKIDAVMDRHQCLLARAPQCFFLGDLYVAHEKARSLGKNDYIDSASMMKEYGYDLCTVNGPVENIKVTSPLDFYIFRAIMDARDNSQIWGL